jgi:hypothetical protein
MPIKALIGNTIGKVGTVSVGDRKYSFYDGATYIRWQIEFA